MQSADKGETTSFTCLSYQEGENVVVTWWPYGEDPGGMTGDISFPPSSNLYWSFWFPNNQTHSD